MFSSGNPCHLLSIIRGSPGFMLDTSRPKKGSGSIHRGSGVMPFDSLFESTRNTLPEIADFATFGSRITLSTGPVFAPCAFALLFFSATIRSRVNTPMIKSNFMVLLIGFYFLCLLCLQFVYPIVLLQNFFLNTKAANLMGHQNDG